jgi:hypothetical protein
MSGLNRKGPEGEGPMTGRRMGHCNPENKGKTDQEILQNRMSSLQPGQGQGRGSGLGQGRGLGKGLKSGRGMRSRFRGNS